MKFCIRRTSDGYEAGGRPCEGAVKDRAPRYDVRTCSEAEFNRRGLGDTWHGPHVDWRDRGTEHAKVRGGGIKRRIEDQDAWSIEIATLDDLVTLAEREGELVVGRLENRLNEGPWAIEIYDAYRE